MSYQHDGSETSSDELFVTISDGAGGVLTERTFTMVITNVNNNPQLVQNQQLNISEGATMTIGSQTLAASDSDNSPAEITYLQETYPIGGSIKRFDTVLSAGDAFTQEQINGGFVSYVHGGGELPSDSFRFTVSDGAGGSVAVTQFNIAVAARCYEVSPTATYQTTPPQIYALYRCG